MGRKLRQWIFVSPVVLAMVVSGCGGSSNSGGGGGGGGTSGDFSISANGSLTVNENGSTTLRLTTTAYGGFTGTINATLSGLPSGVSISPTTITFPAGSSASVQLVAAANATLVNNVPVTVTATSGSVSHTASFTLTIIGPVGFTLNAPSNVSVFDSATQQVYISATANNGFTGNIAVTASGGPSGVTVSPSSFYVSPGSLTPITFVTSPTATGSGTVTFSGTSGSATGSAQTAVTVSTQPDFALTTTTSINAYNGSTPALTVSAAGYNGFTSPITVTLNGLPSGVLASPTTFSLIPGQSQTVALEVLLTAAVGSSVFTVQGVSGSLTHQNLTTFTVLQNALAITPSNTTYSNVTIPAGSFQQLGFNVNSTAYDGGEGPITVAPGTLPPGISVSPAYVNVTASSGVATFYISATASGAQSGSVIFRATWGNLAASTTVMETVGPPYVDVPVTYSSRSKYVRSDSTTGYLFYPPPNWSLYDSGTGRFFAADPYTNHLNVYDSTTEKQIAQLTIPGAFGIDEALDNSTIYVGTITGDLYFVDPAKMVVTKRYSTSSFGASGYPANAVYALGNGKLLLQELDFTPGYSWVDGYNTNYAVWDPTTNSLVTIGENSIINITQPQQILCTGSWVFGVLTNNRSRFLLVPRLTSPPSTQICSYDPNTGTSVTASPAPGGGIQSLAVSPDGNTVAAFDGTNIYVLDALTLAIKNTFSWSTDAAGSIFGGTTLPSSNASMIIGPDNQTLYLAGTTIGNVFRYNMSTGVTTGWAPAVSVASEAGYSGPAIMQAMSGNGLIGGVMPQGFGFLDTNAFRAPPVGTAFQPSPLTIGYGPLSGGTNTMWSVEQTGSSSKPLLGDVYFGANAATGPLVQAETIYATSPAGSAGPVDVLTVSTDYGAQLLPEAFSYGPWVLETPTSYATAEGGGTAEVAGYGFGPTCAQSGGGLSGQPAPIPADLTVRVGGLNASVTAYNPCPYVATYSFMSPFPLLGAEYTVPAGIAGTSENITVTNSAGTITAAQKLTYLPAIQTYPLSGAQLVDGVYDPKRDVYYFTDTNQLRVFSRALNKWLNPIAIPSPSGAYGPQRLWGVAMSPDGSKLAVSDAGAIAFYLIDPDNPTSIQSFPIAKQIFEPIVETPSGVAVTNSGQIYYTVFDQDGDGGFFLWTLNTTTGKISSFGTPPSGLYVPPLDEGNYPYGRLALSADGSRLYFADQGQDGYVSLPSGLITYFSATEYDSEFGYDVVLSANQTGGFLDGIMLDKSGNLEGLETLNYREAFDASWVYGAVISPDGTLLYQPGTHAIDVFDARTGAFQERVSISQTLSSNYRALVGNTKDNVLLAITGSGSGIAVVDLTGLPAAPTLPYVAVSPEENRLGASYAGATRSSMQKLDAQHRSSGRRRSFYRQGLVAPAALQLEKHATQ